MIRRIIALRLPGGHAGPVVAGPLIGRLHQRDMVDGGRYRIHGIARVASQPARRQVLLLDNASFRVVRSTWSDANTGEYRFDWLREGEFVAVERDYAKQYFPDVKDHCRSEAMT